MVYSSSESLLSILLFERLETPDSWWVSGVTTSSEEEINEAVNVLSASNPHHTLNRYNLPQFSTEAKVGQVELIADQDRNNFVIITPALLSIFTVLGVYLLTVDISTGVALLISVWLGYFLLYNLDMWTARTWNNKTESVAKELQQLNWSYWSLLVQFARRSNTSRLQEGTRPEPYTDLDKWTVGVVTSSHTAFIQLSHLGLELLAQPQSLQISRERSLLLKHLKYLPKLLVFDETLNSYRTAHRELLVRFEELAQIRTKEGEVHEQLKARIYALREYMKTIIGIFRMESQHTTWDFDTFFEITNFILEVGDTEKTYQPEIYTRWRAVSKIYHRVVQSEEGAKKVQEKLNDAVRLRQQALGIDEAMQRQLDEVELLLSSHQSVHHLRLDELVGQVATWRNALVHITKCRPSTHNYRRLIELSVILNRDIPILQTQVHKQRELCLEVRRLLEALTEHISQLQQDMQSSAVELGLVFDKTASQTRFTKGRIQSVSLSNRPYTEAELLQLRDDCLQLQREVFKLSDQYASVISTFDAVSSMLLQKELVQGLERITKKNRIVVTDDVDIIDALKEVFLQIQSYDDASIRVESDLPKIHAHYASAKEVCDRAFRILCDYVEAEINDYNQRVNQIRKALKGWKYIRRKRELIEVEEAIEAANDQWREVQRESATVEQLPALEQAVKLAGRLATIQKPFMDEVMQIVEQYEEARRAVRLATSKKVIQDLDDEVRQRVQGLTDRLASLKEKETLNGIGFLLNNVLSSAESAINSTNNRVTVNGKASGFAVGSKSQVANLYGDGAKLDRLQFFMLGEQVVHLCTAQTLERAHYCVTQIMNTVARRDAAEAFSMMQLQEFMRDFDKQGSLQDILKSIQEARRVCFYNIKRKLKARNAYYFCMGFDIYRALWISNFIGNTTNAQEMIVQVLGELEEMIRKAGFSERNCSETRAFFQRRGLTKQQVHDILFVLHKDLIETMTYKQRTVKNN